MLTILSPAKKMTDNFNNEFSYTVPSLIDDSVTIVSYLKKFKLKEIMEFMEVSEKIGQINIERFKTWKLPLTPDKATQSFLAFDGDVYAGLCASTLSKGDLRFAQKNIRILSGLYGLLRPLDLILPYRLEMGRKLKTATTNSLYEFWKEKIVSELNSTENKFLINLASQEYFKSIDLKKLKPEIITPQFKDKKGDKYKIISFYAKRARGLMARFIIDNKITSPSDLKSFNYSGYKFSKKESSKDVPVFLREE